MREKLCDKYKVEREEICKRLIDILKLDANNSFVLCELDKDTEKQTAILGMKEEIQKCKEAGMNDFLVKPLDQDAFYRIVTKYLGLNGSV